MQPVACGSKFAATVPLASYLRIEERVLEADRRRTSPCAACLVQRTTEG